MITAKTRYDYRKEKETMRERAKTTFFLGTFSNHGVQAINLLVNLISIPMGLYYFGPVRYGIWLVIGSIFAYLRLSDLGIGHSVMTIMSHTQNPSAHRTILRNSLKILSGIALACTVTVFLVNSIWPGWVSVLGNIPAEHLKEASIVLFIVAVITFVRLPSSVFPHAFSGLQKIHWSNIYNALYSIASLAALILTVALGGDLVTLAVLTAISGIIVDIVSGAHLFFSHPQVFRRSKENAEAPSGKTLFTTGVRFFGLQIGSMIIFNTDNIIISHFLGPVSVTPYAITFRLFLMGSLEVNAVALTLWPMYGSAFGREDWEWISKNYNRCVSFLLIAAGFFSVGGIIFAEDIIRWWVGPSAYAGLLTAFALSGCLYTLAFSISNFSLIMGINPTSAAVGIGLVSAAFNLGLSMILIGPLGIGGVALATLIVSLLIDPWFGPVYIRHRTLERVRLEKRHPLMHTFLVFAPFMATGVVLALNTNGAVRLMAGIITMAAYLITSWLIMPDECRGFVKDLIRDLPFYKRVSI